MNPWVDILPLILVSASAEPSYESAWARSIELESEGALEASLQSLEEVADQFSQDYPVTLRRAWLNYQLERFERAESLYRSAIELSGGSFEARLGLAWTLLELARNDEAKEAFEHLIVEAPDHATVQQGLDLSKRWSRRTWSTKLVATGHHYTAHPVKTNAMGLTLGLRVRPWPTSQVAVFYRGSYFAGSGPGQGNGNGASAGADDFTQNEVYLSGGYDGRTLGVLGHFAYVGDNSDEDLSAYVGGLSLQVRVFGEIGLSGTWSHYSDLDVLRASLAWRIPLGAGWSVEPAGAFQRTDTEWLGNGSLHVYLVSGIGALWIGAKYGDEARPVYLIQPSTFNLLEQIELGGRAGASVDLGADWLLFTEYEIHRLSDEAEPPTKSFLHLLSFGVTRRF